MSWLQVIQWSGALTGLLFIFALGCIVGSFINVLAYRLPKGINVITPPSRCPTCDTRLGWTENFPVLGWLWLRGRCRFCRSPISPEYPIVEFTVGLLFASLYVLWFMRPSPLPLIGLSVRSAQPEWAQLGLLRMWPMFAIVLTLIGSLVAMTIIDAKTFTIPVVLAWIAAAVALVVHPLHALWIEHTVGSLRSPHPWTIPTPNWRWLGAALGGAAGVGVSSLLLWRGMLPRSFADYEEWEKTVLPPAGAGEAGAGLSKGAQPTPGRLPLGPILVRTILLTGPAIALMFVGFAVGLRLDTPVRLMALGLAVGLLIGIILRRIGPADTGQPDDPIWVRYPHARREMVKELLFLAPAAVLAVVGWQVGERLGAPWGLDLLTGGTVSANAPPLWISALGGALLGMLVGGGLVWAFRIGGSLVLGREAMGMGDVHLMAAVGAALGWIDAVLAFFIAPVFGIAAALLSVAGGRVFRRQGTALPYGPSLAAAALLVIYAKPLFELALTALLSRQGRPIDLP